MTGQGRAPFTRRERLENRAFLAFALTIMAGTLGALCASTRLFLLAGALLVVWVALDIAARAEGRRQ